MTESVYARVVEGRKQGLLSGKTWSSKLLLGSNGVDLLK